MAPPDSWTSRRAPCAGGGYRLVEDTGAGLVEHAPGEVRTYRGALVDDPTSVAAATFTPRGWWIRVRTEDGGWWVEPLAGRVRDAGRQEHALYHQGDVLPSGGLVEAIGSPGATDGAGASPAQSGSLFEAELACDADFEFFQSYGSVPATEARIHAQVNLFNVQFEQDVEIRHVISILIVRTAPGGGGYTSSDPSMLLQQFRAEWTSNQAGQPRDIGHLFTGKNLSGGIVGMGFSSSVCSFETGFVLTQADCCGSLACNADLSAHILGHAWGADDCGCVGYTMSGVLSCANQFHPSETAPEIRAFRDSLTCLDEVLTGDVLYFDDFESGDFFGGSWTTSSPARCRVKQAAAFSGQYGAKLKKGGVGTGPCTVGTERTWMLSPPISTVGYTAGQVRMQAHFRQNELGCERMEVQVSYGGGGFVTIGAVEQHPWTEIVLPLPAGAMGRSDLRVRLITNAKGQKERAEVDDFCVIGT